MSLEVECRNAKKAANSRHFVASVRNQLCGPNKGRSQHSRLVHLVNYFHRMNLPAARTTRDTRADAKGNGAMRITLKKSVVALWLVASVSGCQSAIPAKPGSDSQSNHAGGNNQGGQGATDANVALPSESLTLTSVAAHVDGRRGNRVRLSIVGTQTADSFAYVAVTAFDSNGNALYWFSTHLDENLDSSTGNLVPKVRPSDAKFQFDLLVPYTNALLNWDQAKVALFDRTEAISNDLSTTVEPQPVESKGQACDPAAKADRCDAKLECNATSSTCVDHTGPSLSQVGYWTTANGPIVVATGADNADDVTMMNLGFLDASGASVQVNMNNDATNPLMASNFSETAGFSNEDGQFTFLITPADSFTAIVNTLSFTPVDAIGIKGSAMTAALLKQPSRNNGTSCDINGFNSCSGNATCVPGVPGANNTCQPVTASQVAGCKIAPTIDVSKSDLFVTGYNMGASLWEPPADCVSDVGMHHPESVIKLHVPAKTASLTLSTARPETQIDTVLYVASVCGSGDPTILGCNDDSAMGGVTSTLTLTNVAAGDYYVIVDSMSSDGGPFGLTVTAP